MHLQLHFLAYSTLSTLVFPASSSPLPASSSQTKPPFVLLAGDSTTATQATNGGGWGDGFLATTLHHGRQRPQLRAQRRNDGLFPDGGDSETVLEKLLQYRDVYAPCVTIQFVTMIRNRPRGFAAGRRQSRPQARGVCGVGEGVA